MAKGKSKFMNPIASTPDFGMTSEAMVEFLDDAPDLIGHDSLKLLDGEKPDACQHPNKTNPGKVRYYG